ncbi:MAG TPA: branched-chain amino acid ABC transporter permease [Actinomycetota bacterium]|nr:branched-chain amino acid ABC transporter permease [Actinomycetota bacterium]
MIKRAVSDATEEISVSQVVDPIPQEGHQAPSDDFRPGAKGWLARAAAGVPLAALVLLFPLTQLDFVLTKYTRGITYAIIALSLNVLIGYTGQISLGHQAFVGIGAFTSAYMVSVAGQEFPIAVLSAMAVGAVQALILGLVALRVRGLYFALLTLAYGLLAEASLFKIPALTGGAAGQPAPKPPGFDTSHRYYYLCLALLGVVLWVDHRMMATKGGRALLALRENPRVASTFGINVKAFTLFAFAVSGVFAGLGGALYAHNESQVTSVLFNFQLALLFILMTVVGGLRSRTGVVIGGVFFALIGYLIEEIPHLPVIGTVLKFLVGILGWLFVDTLGLPELRIEVAELVIGPILLLLTLTQFPGGIGQQLRPFIQWFAGRPFDIHDRGAKEVQITDVRA